MSLLAQLAGFGGVAASCLWSFLPTRRLMIAGQMTGAVCFAAHWGLSGNMTAMVLTGLLLAVAGLSLFLDGPAGSLQVRLVRAGYVAALLPVVLATVLTWAGPESAFAAMGTAMGCYARWLTDAGRHRNVLLLSSVPWMAHNLIVLSVPGLLADVICLSRAAWLRWGGRLPRHAPALPRGAVGA
ncbi:MAG TPA: YgjV family protein [Acetobacteraceae bacterium]|jgi:hypothetical protein|nr:YgjV family protein [Acetobacteraceae bacterium]